MNKCLLVLGMHRSGTSAFTGILDLLGVNLGSRMLETQADNPKGFFENKFVVQANDCILETLGRSWDDILPLPEGWQERFADSQLHSDIRTFLREDIAGNPLSALKDPRMSRLLPLWMPHFRAEDVAPHCAIVIRHPLEIAQSLAERNGFSREKSLLLWMLYMLEAERGSRGLPRGFISYDALLQEPIEAVARLFRSAGLDPPREEQVDPAALADFLDGSMRHHALAEDVLDEQCPAAVARFYRLLCRIAARGTADAADLEAIDAIAEAFNADLALFYNRDLRADLEAGDRADSAAELARIRGQFERDKIFREYRYIANTTYLYRDHERMQAEVAQIREHADQLQQHANHLEREISQFIGSPPWRVYKKYQETVEQLLPQGTLRRRMLQGARGLVAGRGQPPAAPVPEPAPASEPAAIEATQQQAPLAFDTAAQPLVSIIIPVFNQWEFTRKCLNSLAQHTRGSYEIIVVDNRSTDETPAMLAAMTGIRVISNTSNEVFVDACNRAAAQARGEYLLLLNNDTEVTAGWLPALLEPFEDDATGIVGAKLVYPDGALQEAGGIVWRDGTGCNFGHGDDPTLPQFNYRRAVDYCSGACLLIRRRLWDALGGFDTRYAPAYYEDTDLCFAARSLNYKVIYQPRSEVVHYGGASAGKETSSGYKRFQEINRHKFVEKWAAVLESDHVDSAAGTLLARERRGDRHILIIDHYVPTFDRDSGSQRMVSMLSILCDMGWKVSFWPDDLTYDPCYSRVLQDMGVETYYGELTFEDVMAVIGEDLDAVLMSRPATAHKYLGPVKKFSCAHTIFDTVDLHFVREQRRLELEVQQWKNLEFYLAEETDTTLVVSPTEKELLSTEAFADKVAVVSNIHALEPCEKGFEERSGLMFIGGFAHPPNEEGVIWFIEYILPMVRRRIPDIHFTIVGAEPTERLLAMAGEHVTVTGYVEDVSGYFNDSRVFVSPLRHGAGVKGKIGQSFSFGLPVVTTSIGAEGMSLIDGQNALITDSETEFADKVVEAYTDRFLWQKLSTGGRQVIREQFSFETIRATLEDLVARRIDRAPEPRPRPVLLHCHLFKNAGSTLDWSLSRQFGEGFVDHRDDDDMRRGAGYLGPYIERHPDLRALSSHHVRFPLPQSDQYHLLPLVALRHPIERARSVYDFERRQDADTPGARQAKMLSFSDYVRWRMDGDVAPTIRNFHCAFLSGVFDSEIGEKEYQHSVAQLTRIPLLVIVERYDESMLLLEKSLAPWFGNVDLAYVAQNVTPGREGSLQERVQAIYDELGPELEKTFRESNHWDVALYEDATAIFLERFGAIGDPERRLENFRARCRALSPPGSQQ